MGRPADLQAGALHHLAGRRREVPGQAPERAVVLRDRLAERGVRERPEDLEGGAPLLLPRLLEIRHPPEHGSPPCRNLRGAQGSTPAPHHSGGWEKPGLGAVALPQAVAGRHAAGQDAEGHQGRPVLVAQRHTLARLALGLEAHQHDGVVRTVAPAGARVGPGLRVAAPLRGRRLGRVARRLVRRCGAAAARVALRLDGRGASRPLLPRGRAHERAALAEGRHFDPAHLLVGLAGTRGVGALLIDEGEAADLVERGSPAPDQGRAPGVEDVHAAGLGAPLPPTALIASAADGVQSVDGQPHADPL